MPHPLTVLHPLVMPLVMPPHVRHTPLQCYVLRLGAGGGREVVGGAGAAGGGRCRGAHTYRGALALTRTRTLRLALALTLP